MCCITAFYPIIAQFCRCCRLALQQKNNMLMIDNLQSKMKDKSEKMIKFGQLFLIFKKIKIVYL